MSIFWCALGDDCSQAKVEYLKYYDRSKYSMVQENPQDFGVN